MVNPKRVTQSDNIPSDILSVWDSFTSQHRTVVYNTTIKPGSSQYLAEACVGLLTCY